MTPGSSRVLTVGIFADLPDGLGGGVNTFTRALVQSLIARMPADMRLVVFAGEDDRTWVPGAAGTTSVVPVEPFRHRRGPGKWNERAWRYGHAAVHLAQLDGLGARVSARFGDRTRRIRSAVGRSPWPLDVMHFPFQSAAPLAVPTIFGLWDLQHLHLPDLRPPRIQQQTDEYYRWCCRFADRVAFGSEWARQDAVARYGLEASRTAVVPAASPLRLSPAPHPAAVEEVRRRYELPARFAFYPSVTWPHKNHRRLIAALARLQTPGLADLHLVCSGQNARHHTGLMRVAGDLGVAARVHFIGHVPNEDVKALYRLAEFCVYPSLFEGAGLPVLEAFDERCPVAASVVGSIPEYAGDAAVLFDPTDTDAIAAAMSSLAAHPERRSRLIARGAERARHFSWERVVDDYQSLYRELAGVANTIPAPGPRRNAAVAAAGTSARGDS